MSPSMVTPVPGARVRARRGGTAWEVSAPRVHALQQLAVANVDVALLTRLDVAIARWRAPRDGWIGDAHLPSLRALHVEADGDGVRLRIEVGEPLDAAVLLAGAVRCLLPVATPTSSDAFTFVPGVPVRAAALAGALHDVLRADESRDSHVRRCDALVVGPLGVDPTPERSSLVVVREDRWTVEDAATGQLRDIEVCVDPTVHRPIGRRSVEDGAVVRAFTTDGGLRLQGDGVDLAVGPWIEAADAAVLRRVRAVVGDVPSVVGRQLAACGVLVASDASALPDSSDARAWLQVSVHERRHALRAYGPGAALDAWPTVSVVLVTHRGDHLDHAFDQLRQLSYPRLEFVLGAHGPGVDAADLQRRATALPGPARVVAIDGARTLGQALQDCCDRAEGSLLTKMDDDDHYGPEHIWDLVLAREYSGAQIVGKALDWVHLAQKGVTVFRPTYAAEKYADFVAGGTILVSRADLAAVGGWRPVPKSVDRALLDRVLGAGGLVYRTHGLGYVYVRHGSGHTATVADEHFLTKTAAQYPGLVTP